MSTLTDRSPTKLLLLCGAFILGFAACQDEATPPRTPASTPTSGTATPVIQAVLHPIAEDEEQASRGTLGVDEDIVTLCALPDAHFPFDSSAIEGRAADALQRLADCLVEGKLRGRSLTIVGHADARGTDSYNFALGHRRAGSVANFLADQGMDRSHLETTSMGEIDADGTNASGWSRDRRVEVLLDDAVMMKRSPDTPYSSLDRPQ